MYSPVSTHRFHVAVEWEYVHVYNTCTRRVMFVAIQLQLYSAQIFGSVLAVVSRQLYGLHQQWSPAISIAFYVLSGPQLLV